MKILIDIIIAARPNFMKAAPLYHKLMECKDKYTPRLVHTGQHYDANMSGDILAQLKLPKPDVSLDIGSHPHAKQTGLVMAAYEEVCLSKKPDITVVMGDVNSTVACTLAAAKLGITTIHLEAGLRSFDRSMPEEINRVATDSISDYFWTPSKDADENLLKEGKSPKTIRRVGNIMIDTLFMQKNLIDQSNALADFGLQKKKYALVTMHRPSNVDEKESLTKIISEFEKIQNDIQMVWSIHPRTRDRLAKFGLMQRLQDMSYMMITQPLGYIPFMKLVCESAMLITDSGGIQEETTVLGIPCLTLRPNTERPITISHGTNRLVKIETLYSEASKILNGKFEIKGPPELWDGHTASRILAHLNEIVGT